jgi:hypothetical protein
MRVVVWTSILFVALMFDCVSAKAGHASRQEAQVQCAFAIQNGLDFVAANQTATGGFITESWQSNAPEQKTSVDAIFTASQILYSLSFCRDSTSARGTEERAATYLDRQREPPGVWHFYGTGTGIKTPVGVDETSTAWTALQHLQVSIPPAALDAVRGSRNGNGLFNTWIGATPALTNINTNDVDAVVNINALLLFGPAHEDIDSVCKYVVAQIDNDSFRRGTVRYPSALMFGYTFSRAYREANVKCLGGGVGKLRDTIIATQNPDGSWGNDLETAFGALSLLNLDYRGDAVDRGIRRLLARQSPDGGWELAPAYRSAVEPLNYGARALTTAVAIEALAKYRSQQ